MTNDCVVRACSLALGTSWDDAYKLLCDLGFEMKEMPNNDKVWKKLLESQGFRRVIISKGNKKPTVKDLAKISKGKKIVAKVAKHVVTIIDGFYYDIYDCGNSSVYTYYEKTK